MMIFLDFEKPIAELEGKIRELRGMHKNTGVDVRAEITQLEKKLNTLLKDTYKSLTPWQKTQVARHPDRPHYVDIIESQFEDYTPLAGDRNFANDDAIMGGLAKFRGMPCVVMGHEKGSDVETRLKHNFGMAKPEGYRKAVRLMELADKFGLPVISLVDTSGAYAGVSAEERGQAEAIARSTEKCLELNVPMINCIIGEGGSGGAVAIAAGNKVLMLEHSIYSVISPEGCASILWRTAEKAKDAAEALKITAQDLKKLGVIDAIIPEPLGGAHRDRKKGMSLLGDSIEQNLKEMIGLPANKLKSLRREKFLNIGRHGLA